MVSSTAVQGNVDIVWVAGLFIYTHIYISVDLDVQYMNSRHLSLEITGFCSFFFDSVRIELGEVWVMDGRSGLCISYRYTAALGWTIKRSLIG